jgi:hypothetical protein
MVNRIKINREKNTYYYIGQVMLFNTLVILKASRISHHVGYILLQRGYILLHSLQEAMYTSLVKSSRLDYLAPGLYPLIPPRQVT